MFRDAAMGSEITLKAILNTILRLWIIKTMVMHEVFSILLAS
jgi:hypothetical protein